MSDVEISVVIPIYNTSSEKLDRLFSSFERQKGDCSIELVIVDDGSNREDTIAFLESVSSNRCALKLLHQKNKGVSAARNLGIKNASGHYLAFVDSDDYVSASFSKSVIEAFRDNPEVGVLSFNWIDWIKGFPFPQLSSNRSRIIDSSVALGFLCENSHFQGYPWNKAINLSVLNREDVPLFSSLRLQEDRLWCLELLSMVDRVMMIPRFLYSYVFNPGSALNDSIKYYTTKAEIMHSMYVFAEECRSKFGSDSAYYKKTIRFSFGCVYNDMMLFIKKKRNVEIAMAKQYADFFYDEACILFDDISTKKKCDMYARAVIGAS